MNHNTFNPSRRKKHFYVVYWSGPDDSIFVRTHSYNRLKKIIFISWNDKFYWLHTDDNDMNSSENFA